MRKKAFTFVELMVVMSIIAILIIISVLSYGNAQAKSRDSERKTDLNKIAVAIEMYKTDHRVLPSDSGGFIKTVSGGALYQALVSGKYLDSLPCDPQLSGTACDSGYLTGQSGYFYLYNTKNNAAVLSGATTVSGCTSSGMIPQSNRDQSYSLYTHLEKPTDEDLATITSGCNFDYINQSINSGSYTINFRIGN